MMPSEGPFMNRWLCSLVAVFLACAGVARGEPAAKPVFNDGQEWTFRINGQETDQTLVILRSGPVPKGGVAFDVEVKSLPLADGSTIPLVFRISQPALEHSVVRM